ncbi:MAG: hypothetical protein JXQ73_10175 [Phycisphaerae bacterium]|nr:hypothetical protein [Phycisphaerae bacterium]
MSGRSIWVAAWLLLSAVVLTSTARAELIVLKDGQEVEGKIVSKTEEAIKVRITTASGISMTRTIRHTEIKRIEKEAAPAKAAGAAKQEEPAAQTDPDEAKDQAEAEKGRRLPIEIDLRMALKTPVIRDQFEDGNQKVQPRGSGYFVLVPFRYGPADEPYTLTRYTIKFAADRGSTRSRGFVPLELKGGGGRPPARGKAAGKEKAADSDILEPIELEPVKGAPLYEKIGVYQRDGDLLVYLQDVFKPKTEQETKATGAKSSRSSRSYSRGRSSRSHGRSSGRTRSSRTGYRGGSRSSARPSSYGRTPAREEKTRGYERREDEKEKKGEDRAEEETEEIVSSESKSPGDKRIPDEAVAGTGWAAALVELDNDAAEVTAHVGKQKVLIDLRLMDALEQKSRGGRGAQSEDELDTIETLADFVTHESPALSRLAVIRLSELRSSSKSRSPGRRDAKAAEEPVDEGSRIIEEALLEAITSPDEQTRRLAWWELTSTETLPKSTEQVIVGAKEGDIIEALLALAETELASAAKAPAIAESGKPGRAGPTRGAAPKRAPSGKGAEPAKTVEFAPVGLGESSAKPGVWQVLGALMRVRDEKVAARAIGLALKDGSRQALDLLGVPDPQLAAIALRIMATAPNTPGKHQAVRMILAAATAMTGGDAVLPAVAQIAQAMAQAGDPLRITSPDDVLMRVAAVLRDRPAQQLQALGILQWCSFVGGLDTSEMEQWLASMTDQLVARDCQAATYQVIASKWMPTRLPPLGRPGVPAAVPPAAASPVRGAPLKRPPTKRVPGRGAPAGAQAEATKGEAAPQGVIEKFLFEGLKTRTEAPVQMAIVLALLRAGRNDLVLEQLKTVEPLVAVQLIKLIGQLTGQIPPSLVPGMPSRFIPLGFLMGMTREQKDTKVRAQVAASLEELAKGTSEQDQWRLGLAFKRTMEWDAVASLCLAADPQAAERAKKTIGDILGLVEGERSAMSSVVDSGQMVGKLTDYDKQRGAKLAGKYQGLVLCDVLAPTYTLMPDATSDPQAKERSAKIANLTWSRQILGLEPGVFEVSVGQDRKIEVKLGAAVVGAGQAPTAKEPEAGGGGESDPRKAALAKRLAELKKSGAQPGGASGAPPASTFAIELPKLMVGMMSTPSLAGKVPLMIMLPPKAEVPAKAPAKGQAPAAPAPVSLECSMHHLAFGTRQGGLKLGGDGQAPKFDSLDVVVGPNGRIIRGAQVLPILQEIQVFLEPVR